MKFQPKNILISYIFVIIGAAFLHTYFKTLNQDGPLNAIYFSIATITTLGYGDVTPGGPLGKIFACAEALYGIVAIGLFLNSLWQAYIERIQKEQQEELEKKIRDNEREKLSTYLSYVKTVLDQYVTCAIELTTPIANRAQYTTFGNFVFSDLQDLYNPSLLIKNSITKSVVRRYYERQDTIRNEMKYVLSNFNLESQKTLRSTIMEILQNFQDFDVSDALLGYETNMTGGTTVAKMLESMIKAQTTPPNINNYQHGNIIIPAIFLFQSLEIQVTLLGSLNSEIDQISI